MPITYDAATQKLACSGRRNPLPLINGKVRLRVLADRTSLEIFGNDGLLYMPMAAKFAPDNQALALVVADAPIQFDSLRIDQLRSIWPPNSRRPGRLSR